jgi:hypothetical protein
MSSTQKKNIAIFASGTGTNAANIIRYFSEKRTAHIALIVSNNPTAGVLKIAEENNIPVLMLQKEKFFRGDAYVPELQHAAIDFIVLAGFLWKLPSVLIKAIAITSSIFIRRYFPNTVARACMAILCMKPCWRPKKKKPGSLFILWMNFMTRKNYFSNDLPRLRK